jgi:hypothetical protein
MSNCARARLFSGFKRLFIACLFASSAMVPKSVAFASAPDADPQAAARAAIQNLCSQGIEGSYVGLDSLNETVRINLICVGPDRLFGSAGYLYPGTATQPASGITYSGYGYSAVDGGQLILAAFPIFGSERDGASSKTSGHYIKIDIAQALNGEVHALMLNGNIATPVSLIAKKAIKFPLIQAVSAAHVSSGSNSQNGPPPDFTKSFTGTYSFQFKGSAGQIYADILVGSPAFTIAIGQGAVVVHLLIGPDWTGDGTFTSIASYGDGESDQRSPVSIRGRALNETEMEFYWIDPYNGLIGPIHAVKTNSTGTASKRSQGKVTTPGNGVRLR